MKTITEINKMMNKMILYQNTLMNRVADMGAIEAFFLIPQRPKGLISTLSTKD